MTGSSVFSPQVFHGVDLLPLLRFVPLDVTHQNDGSSQAHRTTLLLVDELQGSIIASAQAAQLVCGIGHACVFEPGRSILASFQTPQLLYTHIRRHGSLWSLLIGQAHWSNLERNASIAALCPPVERSCEHCQHIREGRTTIDRILEGQEALSGKGYHYNWIRLPLRQEDRGSQDFVLRLCCELEGLNP